MMRDMKAVAACAANVANEMQQPLKIEQTALTSLSFRFALLSIIAARRQKNAN